VASFDLLKALNAISDVVQNRPPAIRVFDQIYMKFGDMLLQTEHASRVLDKKKTIFIGDGDAVGLCLMHLKKDIFQRGPASILVLDFDERIVNSVNSFAHKHRLEKSIGAELYNVADPLPKKYWEKFEAFYTNPPFGANNEGRSVWAFMRRGIEATKEKSVGCVVMADYPGVSWSKQNIHKIQTMALKHGFAMSEMLPEFHHYHLDDVPELTSCSITFEKVNHKKQSYGSKPLDGETLKNFYGRSNPLIFKYVRDLRNDNKYESQDYRLERL
jgi:predicted methyltransferase